MTASITLRIRIFNKILKEFYDNLEIDKFKLKFQKIKKYNEFKQFNEEITKNIKDVIDMNYELIDKVKLLKKYKNASSNFIEDNKEVIFNYIKNLYYATIEDQEYAEKIKKILSMKIDDNLLLKLFTQDSLGIKKIVEEISEEIKPFLEQFDLKDLDVDLDSGNMQNIIQDALKTGTINIKGKTAEQTKKINELIQFIQEKVKEKIESGKININELKNSIKNLV